MRVADDRRGRVPFAIVGVVLLVGSTAFATALSTTGPERLDRAVEESVDRVSAETTAVVRRAAAAAARRAGREPVTRPAGTPTGGVLDPSRPFRDALRLRIYATARRQLRTVRHRRGDATANASLPATPDAKALESAIERVRIEGTENGTALRVTVDGIAITAQRDGAIVVDASRNVTVTVDSPVLALHDRAVRYERRLNRGPLDGPGVGRRLTARLYPLVWARGYAQYAGLPVENVLADRHVAAAANGAVLGEQRVAFGRADPAGRRGVARAVVRLGVQDALASTPLSGERWAEEVLVAPNGGDGASRIPEFDTGSSPGPEHSLPVGVNRTADRAFVSLVDGEGNASLSAALRRGYRVRTRVRTRTRPLRVEPKPRADPPGEEWELRDSETEASADTQNVTGNTPAVEPGERAFLRYSRRVVLDRTIRRTWTRGNETRTTTADWTEAYRVGVVIAGEYAPGTGAPDRPVEPLYERGGARDGPNLADVPDRAVNRLVEQRGGRGALAARAALGRVNESTAPVFGTRPDGLGRWIRADLDGLRRRVRNLSVAVAAGDLATGQVNPPVRLARKLDRRRSVLLGAPRAYDGAADRTRYEIRAAYLDAVARKLRERARDHRRRRGKLNATLRQTSGESLDGLARIAATDPPVTPRRAPIGSAPGGPVIARPAASPPYLTVAAVGHEQVAAIAEGREFHPLVARNLNLFTTQWGAVDAVGSGEDGVALRVGARTLLAAERGPADVRTDRLRQSVSTGVEAAQKRAESVLAAETSLSPAAREQAVAAAAGRWNSSAARAIAAADGRLATAIAEEAVQRGSGSREDALAARLRVGMGNAVARETIQTAVVDATTSRLASASTPDGQNGRAVSSGNRERGSPGRTRRKSAVRVPAGLPIAPVPGYWYATINVWVVEIRGAYARFALRTQRASLGKPVRYVRDGSTVEVDVDADGEDERLGRDERVDLETSTTVAIAVPPGRSGVGDVAGGRNETSAGWPRPGCAATTESCPE